MEKIISEMKRLGLTEYEVKAYLSLLKDYPSKGYALSKNSGVPRSRIYEVMDGLLKKQIIFEHKDGKTRAFSPLEPSLLMKKLRKEFESTIDAVDVYTMGIYQANKEVHEAKQLRGRDHILEIIQVLIREAKHRIALSIWDQELVELQDDLALAKSKGLLIRGVYFGTNKPYDELISHRRIERYVAEKDERYIIAVIDDQHVVSGIISIEDARATWSQDPNIIDISDDFIAHDVMLNKYSSMLEGRERALYEKRLDQVRKDYYGYSDEAYDLMPLPDEDEL